MGGGAVWTAFALDTESGDLHVAVDQPVARSAGPPPRGDNLYTNSIVVLDVRTGKLRWHRQLVPNDSHDWDVTHATPIFTGPRQRRAAAAGDRTAGKDGMLRALDRDTHRVLYETPVTTRENAETPVITHAAARLPGRARRQPVERAGVQPGTNLLYVPAVDWCATFSSFEQVRVHPGQARTWAAGRISIRRTSRRAG